MGQAKRRLFFWRCYGLVFWDNNGREGTAWGWSQCREDFLDFNRDVWRRNLMDNVRYFFVPVWMLWIIGDPRFFEESLRDSGKWEAVGQWQ